MGYTLTLYQASWEQLRESLVDMAQDGADEIYEHWLTMVELDAEDLRATWDESLAEISQALVANPPGAEKMIPLSEEAETVLVAVVDKRCPTLGILTHSSSGGEEFRDRFLGEVEATAFGEPRLKELLTFRPFYGLVPTSDAGWGGLLFEELKRMTAQYRPPARQPDKDMAAWHDELLAALRKATGLKSDILTLYY